jgi:tungstate transport system permease protein
VAAFGAIISEVGAVMLVGGNIAGQTRVLTTSIVLDTRQGDFSLALALGVILLGITVLVNTGLMRLQK